MRASDARADHSLRFKDVCKRDLSLVEMNPNTSGVIAPDRDAWRHGVKEGTSQGQDEGQGRGDNQTGGEKETTRITSRSHRLHLYQVQ